MTDGPGSRSLAFHVRDLGFRVGGADILCDIDLEIEEGSFLGIIGPNGAGKTTLLNLLSGLLVPDVGVPLRFLRVAISGAREFVGSRPSRRSAGRFRRRVCSIR
jgi:ABC-type branched-subunit amino acid transport system ATPase component